MMGLPVDASTRVTTNSTQEATEETFRGVLDEVVTTNRKARKELALVVSDRRENRLFAGRVISASCSPGWVELRLPTVKVEVGRVSLSGYRSG